MSVFRRKRGTMSGLLSLGALIIGGVIVADILTHPTGTAAASSGINQLWSSSISGLLGTVPASGTSTATSTTSTAKKG